MKNNDFMLLLKYAAITGNILFVLWIAFNAMDEGFRGTLYEKLSGIGMICLLILNCILLISKSQKQAFTQQQKAN